MTLVSDHLAHLLNQTNSPIWGGYVNMLKTLESMFQSPKHWILEFLQNAEDASSNTFEIRLNNGSLEIMNDGKAFSDLDFYSVCDVNSKKLPSLGLRGYLGIGFKSIFRITDRIEIHSGQFHFSFEKAKWGQFKETQDLALSKWPWEILPIEIAPKILPDPFKTVFEIPLNNEIGKPVLSEIVAYLTNSGFPDVIHPGFPKEIVLLLNSVKTIRINNADQNIVVNKSPILSQEMLLGDRICRKEIANVKRQVEGATLLEESNYLVFRTEVTVDEYIRKDPDTERVRRSEIITREIGLVFPLDSEGNIIPSLGMLTGVYSFLPIEGEQTGLPFGIFGDFIPSPGRDQINYAAKWNIWTCKKIYEFFKEVVNRELLNDQKWQAFPSQAYDVLKRSSRGTAFWNEHLRQPIIDYLAASPIFLDEKNVGHTLNQIFVPSPEIKEIFKDSDLEHAYGKKLLNQSMLKLKVVQPNSTEEDILIALNNKELLNTIKNDLDKLIILYTRIEHLSDYYISGRPQGRGTRDIPLRLIEFVLGDDNEFHPCGFTKLLQEVEGTPSVLNLVPSDNKVSLHPTIAKNEKAVIQLKRCGLQVVDIKHTTSVVEGVIRDVAGGVLKCPNETFIDAELWLFAHDKCFSPKVVNQEGTLQFPSDTFVPGSHLNWQPLWESNFLPGYSPINQLYFTFASKYGLEPDQLNHFLEEIGCHGFVEKKDERLTQVSAEAFAEDRLKKNGHLPESVADHDKLGYDMICQGHCCDVFEIKGMTEASDISLQPSQVEKAKEYSGYDDKSYILVCVHNLPCRAEEVLYKEVPRPDQYWVPEEKARVPKKKWLKA